MLKLESSSKCSPFNPIDLLRCFFYCSKQFLNLLTLMINLVLLPFLFHLFHIGKTFPFEDCFSSAETKKVAWGEIE